MSHDLDDLFRQELDGHASAPGPDLWARLQARTAADAADTASSTGEAHPVDTRFRAGLAAHPTPPRRELWERLEDEHLRPRQRRRPVVVAWGRLAVAASLLLLVLAGGAGWWWGYRSPATGPVATTRPLTRGTAGSAPKPLPTVPASTAAATPTPDLAAQATRTALAAEGQPAIGTVAATAASSSTKKNRKNFSTRATGQVGFPSSSPVASTAARRRAATAPQPVPGLLKVAPPSDATTGTTLARRGGRNTPASQPPTQPETSALAAAPPQVIEVEVRHGSRAAAPAEPLVVAAAAPAPTAATNEPRRRVRLGGLLRQAGQALRGEQVSLAEATGLPEAVTVQAHLGDRVLSKTIRL